LFNWRQEAARFTPGLRVLEHAGPERPRDAAALAGWDVIVTTYGTVRRDAAFLAAAEFDYVVLDEAQAIKNADTDSAKAVRLLRGRHRLAVSGTPVENHLGELWSLFEFLNPGMLGASRLLRRLGQDGEAAAEGRDVLARALRPFILRRTKQQVGRDLPPRSEQTISCPLGADQRRTYDEIRDHYRDSVLRSVRRQGIGRSAFLILEALLRLRQAACHPALIEPARSGEPSAKLDALIPMLDEVRAEGHKAIVFSQFTRMLGLVRSRLDASGVPYGYLDGQTVDRQARVERFQSDPDCALFLVSLKAGGLGLNLTAAEYVFLLDPWWNPAVEMQAIDRAHRIGQTRPVFAYRLVAPGTVEERILELQQTKRDLAAAIVTEDNGLIRSLGPDDLRLLLS
jgi:SNF2 family DNA or RNA helicase